MRDLLQLAEQIATPLEAIASPQRIAILLAIGRGETCVCHLEALPGWRQAYIKVIADLGIEADVIKVTDYNQIMEYPILSTPGLVINERVVCSGRIPTPAEVTTWVTNALEAAS
ncbi:MAG: thioredoxin family protein [Anaerolineales bacterium]